MNGDVINGDIGWLTDTRAKLIAMNEKYGASVPDNPRQWEPIQMAYIFSAEAIRGCERTIRYLQVAVKEEAGIG